MRFEYGTSSSAPLVLAESAMISEQPDRIWIDFTITPKLRPPLYIKTVAIHMIPLKPVEMLEGLQLDNWIVIDSSPTQLPIKGRVSVPISKKEYNKFQLSARITMDYERENGWNYNGIELTAPTICHLFVHPGPWSWEKKGIKQNAIISKVLTADLANKWVEHLAAWKSWSEDEDYYSFYDAYFDPDTGKGYKVKSNDIIYLAWINNCLREAPHAHGRQLTQNDNIISADIFKLLDFYGTGDD